VEARDVRRESRLFDELGLVFDGFAIIGLPPGDPEFLNQPLAAQVQWVDRLAHQEGAVAVIWLASPKSWELMLHVVAVETGRTMVRSIAAPEKPGAEVSLALAARELLGAAYLFDPLRPSTPAAVRDLAMSVRRQVAPAAAPVAPPSGPWGLSALGIYTQGLLGQQGPSAQLGGSAWIDRRLGSWHPAFSLVAAARPRSTVAGSRIEGWEIAPGLSLAYEWERGRLRAGPWLGVEMTYQDFVASTADGSLHQSLASWTPRALLGGAVDWALGSGVSLELKPALGFPYLQNQLVRSSDGARLLATPWIDFEIALGVHWSA
jgi:hypothetical protein